MRNIIYWFLELRTPLFSFERRFSHDAEFAKKYDAVVQEYVSPGHTQAYTQQPKLKPETSKTWYLPHHGVVNLSSSTPKVRVVFDGTAEHEDTSLNSNLLCGPNLLVSLLGVLLRFRRILIPIGADIEKMFHQVNRLARSHNRLTSYVNVFSRGTINSLLWNS